MHPILPPNASLLLFHLQSFTVQFQQLCEKMDLIEGYYRFEIKSAEVEWADIYDRYNPDTGRAHTPKHLPKMLGRNFYGDHDLQNRWEALCNQYAGDLAKAVESEKKRWPPNIDSGKPTQ